MKEFAYVVDGLVAYTVAPGDTKMISEGAFGPPENFFELPAEVEKEVVIGRGYVKDGVIHIADPAPYPTYCGLTSDGTWLVDTQLAKADKKQTVTKEVLSRSLAPCNGFDADDTASNRISGMIARLQRGDGLPLGWAGWRDANNNMHWAEDNAATVLTHLIALSRMIEDREQVLLVASWTHKSNIEVLSYIDDIVAYDVTVGWPT